MHRRFCLNTRFPCRAGLAITVSLALSVAAFSAPRLSVKGNDLFDPCGERIVLRGANNLIIYPDRAGESTLPGLAASGANVIRAHWRIFSRGESKPAATPQELDLFISNAWEHGLFVVVSVWEAGGDRTPDNQWHDVIARWWTSPEIVEVVRKHESHLIVNIANEWDREDMPDIDFNRRVIAAVREMREAGIRTPIMVDADGYGRNGEGLVDNGPFLLEQDPDRNLIFSWHFYDAWMTRQDIASLLERANQAGICFVVGEFSRVGEGNPRELQWEALLEEAAQRDIGWLIWDWGSPDPDRVAKFSVTVDNQFGHWANPPWGEAIGVKHPDGLSSAQRTHFQKTRGQCGDGRGQGELSGRSSAPTDVRVIETLGAAVHLAWQHDFDLVENFDIEVREPDGEWRVVRTVGPVKSAWIGYRETFHQNIGLRYGTAYQARVRARDVRGFSPPSGAVSLVTGDRMAAVGSGEGLRMEIFDMSRLGAFFQERVEVRRGQIIDFDWQDEGPNDKAGVDGFGVKWLGLLVPPLDGDYTFHLASDDAAEIWLDGLLVWDNWGRYSKYPQPEASFRLRNLIGGRPYELEVRYAEVDGPARVRLEWWHRAIAREVIPAQWLYPPLRN